MLGAMPTLPVGMLRFPTVFPCPRQAWAWRPTVVRPLAACPVPQSSPLLQLPIGPCLALGNLDNRQAYLLRS